MSPEGVGSFSVLIGSSGSVLGSLQHVEELAEACGDRRRPQRLGASGKRSHQPEEVQPIRDHHRHRDRRVRHHLRATIKAFAFRFTIDGE